MKITWNVCGVTLTVNFLHCKSGYRGNEKAFARRLFFPGEFLNARLEISVANFPRMLMLLIDIIDFFSNGRNVKEIYAHCVVCRVAVILRLQKNSRESCRVLVDSFLLLRIPKMGILLFYLVNFVWDEYFTSSHVNIMNLKM